MATIKKINSSPTQINKILYNAGILIDAYRFNLIEDEEIKNLNGIHFFRKLLNNLSALIYRVLLTIVFINYLLVIILIQIIKQPIAAISFGLYKLSEYIFHLSMHIEKQID